MLRYGQKFGGYKYENLNRLFQKFENEGKTLAAAHEAKFARSLAKDEFNNAQVFVVMTNGIDFKTREAVQYWRGQQLDIRPWIYRVYNSSMPISSSKSEMLIEISTFSSEDNPYEDISEGYQILNTNIRNSTIDHESMLCEHIAAAYFHPWKHKIENLSKGDVVFLYQSGVGIVAVGKASGELKMRDYQGNPKHADDEYYMTLNQFRTLSSPLSAAEIKDITGVNHRFMSTMFAVDADAGKKLYQEALASGRA